MTDPNSRATQLRNRYSSAYSTAHGTVGFGRLIKYLGIGLGVLVFVSAPLMQERLVDVLVYFAVAMGVILGTFLYALGESIASNGQLLLASLDSAVNSSPFLSDDQKAEIIGI